MFFKNHAKEKTILPYTGSFLGLSSYIKGHFPYQIGAF